MSLIDKLPKKLTTTMGKLWLKTQKASPEICVIGGMACGIGALVLVGVKTWKHKEKLESDQKAIESYTTTFLPVNEEEEKDLTKKQAKRIIVDEKTGNKMLPVKIPYKNLIDSEKEHLIANRIDFAKDIVKVYWLPASLEIASIVLIWKGRSILRKDLSAMTAAYAAAMEAYRKYRERVVEKYGKQADEELLLGYDKEERVDENGNVETVYKPGKAGSLNPYGFWFNGGYYDENGNCVWRNDVWSSHYRDRNQLLLIVKQEQEQANREARTIGYWRLENTMLRLGQPPKEAAKFHDYGFVNKDGKDIHISFGVLDDDDQLEVNKGFTSPFHSQDICYINPNCVEYIGYINDELEKYDMRYGYAAQKDLPYKSFNREANRLIQQYNKEEMGRMIFNGMSDRGKRKMAKILK